MKLSRLNPIVALVLLISLTWLLAIDVFRLRTDPSTRALAQLFEN